MLQINNVQNWEMLSINTHKSNSWLATRGRVPEWATVQPTEGSTEVVLGEMLQNYTKLDQKFTIWTET